MNRIDNFEIAFRANHAGCRGECYCGKVFYNGSGGWDWEDGEIERLESSDAISVDYSIGYIEFEGKAYVDSCNCRDERVEMILDFIDCHSTQIAEYLNLEAKQAMSKAKSMVVNDEI